MRHIDVHHTCKSSMQQSSQRREEGMEMLTNEQLRITGSVVDSPAWSDVKVMQDVKKVAVGISCTRSCASLSGSAAAEDSRVQVTCRSMAAAELDRIGSSRVCCDNGARSQQSQHDVRQVWRIRAFLDTKSGKRFSVTARQ
jgi:hypothetical protein